MIDCIRVADPFGPFILRSCGKEWVFEEGHVLREPVLLKVDGTPKKNSLPGERSPFWAAYNAWVKAGRSTEKSSDGRFHVCLWKEKTNA